MMEALQTLLLVSAGLLMAYHVISASFMSREIMVWVPSKKRKFKLMLLVWLVPVFGLRLANKKAQLGLFEETHQPASAESMGMGLLEIEAVFNPGAKHRIEAVQQHKVQVSKKNGQDKGGADDRLPTTLSQPDKNL